MALATCRLTEGRGFRKEQRPVELASSPSVVTSSAEIDGAESPLGQAPTRLRQIARQTARDRTYGATKLPVSGLLVGYTFENVVDGRYIAYLGPWTPWGCRGIQIRAESEKELHSRCRRAIGALVGRDAAGRDMPWNRRYNWR